MVSKNLCKNLQAEITAELENTSIKMDVAEYESIIKENKLLKNVILTHFKQPHNSMLDLKTNHANGNSHSEFDFNFYLKIIIAICVIILALAFHIVYLSVASCLFYTNGDSSCWIKSWLGMRVYASFFIDLTLYLLIGLQMLLIVLILKSKINELTTKKQD